jgi:hypothetical protein
MGARRALERRRDSRLDTLRDTITVSGHRAILVLHKHSAARLRRRGPHWAHGRFTVGWFAVFGMTAEVLATTRPHNSQRWEGCIVPVVLLGIAELWSRGELPPVTSVLLRTQPDLVTRRHWRQTRRS